MFEISSVLAQPVGLITDAIFLAWLCLLSKLALQYQIPILYQLIWRICVCAIVATFILLPGTTLKIFIVQFSFRYVRLLVNLTAFCLYKPIVISGHPDLTARNVTVIIPTVEPYGKLFEECIESIYASGPAKIIIVTAGAHNYDRAIESASMYPDIRIMRCHIQNKRKQLQIAIREVATPFTILCDDHVFWPSKNFLPSILAPFQDLNVGCVGTNKRVRRLLPPTLSSADFWNFLGCLYLERHNFETAATATVDGGVFVLSGRTSAHRSHILNDEAFLAAFTNERILFGRVGPLNADDDNFITRWMLERGWGIKTQHSADARVETTLGSYPKFLRQCTRWARTTWRSNARSLVSTQMWRTQPWCLYAVHLTSLVNFALFYDAAQLLTLWLYLAKPPPGNNNNNNDDDNDNNNPFRDPWTGILALAVWIFGSKLVKPWPHFRRHPRDLVYLPGYILFGYAHSLIKAYALLTFWDTAWGSRSLGDEEGGDAGSENGEQGGRGGGGGEADTPVDGTGVGMQLPGRSVGGL